MPLPAELFIAARYLRPRQRERFVALIGGFSLIGIMLGVATLIVVMSVMNGFRAELFKQILGLNGHISVYDGRQDLSDYMSLAQKISAIKGVVSALPQIEGQAMITAGGSATGVVVRGIAPEDLNRRPILSKALRAGNTSGFRGENSVIIGSRLAERLGLSYGDSLTLVAPQASRTAFGLVPRYKTYEIADIFEIGMYEYDNNFIYMPLAAARAFFKLAPETVHNIDVLLENDDAVDAVSARIQTLKPNIVMRDWRQANSSFFSALQVERNVMFLILTLIIIVAAFNIISSLIMLVKDKTRDIAVLRTIGASQNTILRLFVLVGSSLGMLGTFLGVILGVVIALNIEAVRQGIERLFGVHLFPGDVYFLTRLPSKLDLGEVAAVAAMALGLSLIATLYPARRAARLDPVEALRHG